jgi:hypothetical protein
MVPVDSVGVPRDPTYSGTSREAADFRVRDCHPLWSNFPQGSASRRFVTPMGKALQPRRGKPPRFGLFRFRSPLLTESIFLSFPPVTEMFQFTGLPAPAYEFSGRQFGYLGINACLTASPSFSQSSTPFKDS